MRIETCRRRRKALLRQIKRLCRLRNTPDLQRRIERLIDSYLADQMVQLAVLDEIYAEKTGAKNRVTWWPKLTSQPTAPRSYERLRQPVEWFHKRKASGGTRKVCDLPIGTKLFHVLAKDVLTATHNPGRHIGDWPGRGRDWLVQRLAEQLAKSHNQFVVVTDIRSCFASINPDVTYQLRHLPERFVRIVLDSRSQRFIRKPEGCIDRPITVLCISDGEAIPRGLLEGSPASNAILAILLNDLADQFEEGVSVFIYCDNIVLVAPDEEMAVRAGSTLRRYCSSGRLGCLSLHQDGPFIRPVTSSFDFLGYSFRARGDGHLRVDLTDDNYTDFIGRLDDLTKEPQSVFQRQLASFPALSDESRDHLRLHVEEELSWRA